MRVFGREPASAGRINAIGKASFAARFGVAVRLSRDNKDFSSVIPDRSARDHSVTWKWGWHDGKSGVFRPSVDTIGQ
jgi:hypothetical protein